MTVRPATGIAPVNRYGVRVARQLLSHALQVLCPPLRATLVEPVWNAAVRGEWVRGPKATRTDAVIFYIHGGGFFAGSPRTHRGVTSRLSTATRLPVFSVSYRLAPEHRFPAAPDDVANGYRWLIEQGYSPDRIVIAGDSAGGFLAMDLVIENARTDAPQPAAAVLISPMHDLSLAIAEEHERTRRDAFVSVVRARSLVELYTGGSADPRLELRPVRGMALPPTLIQVGDAEFLTADSVDLADRLDRAGAHCELQVWPDQMHVFHALAALVPESRSAYRAAAQFITTNLDPADTIAV